MATIAGVTSPRRLSVLFLLPLLLLLAAGCGSSDDPSSSSTTTKKAACTYTAAAPAAKKASLPPGNPPSDEPTSLTIATNVGDVIGPSTPRLRSAPRTNVVFPAPRSPDTSTTSPGASALAS